MDDPTFVYRLAFGLAVLGVLGIRDLVRNPDNPKRLKEYAFLFGVTLVVMGYGLAHDAVTFAISPRYYREEKLLAVVDFFPDVAVLALQASWTAGLGVGLAILVANNPSKRAPQLPYKRLAWFLLLPLTCSPLVAATFGGLARLVWQFDLKSTVHLIHIGTYAGAIVGTVAAALAIRRARYAATASASASAASSARSATTVRQAPSVRGTGSESR